MLISLLLIVGVSFATQCHWICPEYVPNAVFTSTCEPKCFPATCEFYPPCPGHEPVAWNKCNPDGDPHDTCPLCVVMAEAPPEECEESEILCKAPVCGWDCTVEQQVRDGCTVECEKPACQFQDLVFEIDSGPPVDMDIGPPIPKLDL